MLDVILLSVDELVDILDEGGESTGKVAWKSVAHREGLWHRCFHCWIVNPDGPFLLFQRRASVKDIWPGYLDVTAAGHLAAGEKPLDGRREIEEELGLRVDPESLIPLGTRRIEQEITNGHDHEFHEVFVLLDSTPLSELRLQPEEVDAVLRIHLESVERLRTGDTVAAEEWRAGELRTTPVNLTDFVPNEDDYPRLGCR